MTSHVTSLLAEVERQRRALSKETGSQLWSEKTRASLRQLVEKYFNEVRPLIQYSPKNEEHLPSLDATMQELIALCHKKGSINKYKDLLRQSKSHLIHLDTGLVSGGNRDGGAARTDSDTRIIVTLRALLPSAALSFEQALDDLDQPERLSWRGPATDLREALRETLDHLAPDADVMGATEFKMMQGASGPTMKQKVRYILRNRGKSKAISSSSEDATETVEEALGGFVRSVYTRSSVSTHTPTDKNEVLRILNLVRVVFSELLEIH